MNSVSTKQLVFPPGTEWLNLSGMNKEQLQVQNARGELSRFADAAINNPGTFGKAERTICGISYEQAFRLARTVMSLFKANGIRSRMQIMDRKEGDAIDSFRLSVGSDTIKFVSDPNDENFDMIREAQEGL